MDVNSKIESARLTTAVAGVTIYGVTLNEWVAAATLVYLIVQMIVLMPRAIQSIEDIKKRITGHVDQK